MAFYVIIDTLIQPNHMMLYGSVYLSVMREYTVI